MTTEPRTIVVSPRSALEAVIARYRPERVVSLRSPDVAPLLFTGLAEGDVLHLAFNDIAENHPGLVSPSPDHVKALLAFVARWQSGPLLIHCYAGISRSTAAALIVAAALTPSRDEAELARSLRELSPEATPNPYLLRLADDVLGRDGRLSRAVAAIGRGAEAFEGTPFALPLDACATG